MKHLLTLIFGLWAAASLGSEGGNSSGGDEPFGSGSIPYESRQAELVGVVGSVSGVGPWHVSFRKLYLGAALDVDIVKRGRFTPTTGDLLFVRLDGKERWIGRSLTLSADRERALASYLADASAVSRLAWAREYLKHTDPVLSWSAELELGIQAKGSESAKVLELLVLEPTLLALQKRVPLLALFLPAPEAETILKAIVIDGQVGNGLRSKVAREFFFRPHYKSLLEAWKDGREGADAWLKAEAARAWKQQYGGKPVLTEIEATALVAELATARRQKAIGRSERN